jgi:hypothetical protein
MLLVRAASITWANGRGLGLEIENFLGPVIGECHLVPKKFPLALIKDAACIKSITHTTVISYVHKYLISF